LRDPVSPACISVATASAALLLGASAELLRDCAAVTSSLALEGVGNCCFGLRWRCTL